MTYSIEAKYCCRGVQKIVQVEAAFASFCDPKAKTKFLYGVQLHQSGDFVDISGFVAYGLCWAIHLNRETATAKVDWWRMT